MSEILKKYFVYKLFYLEDGEEIPFYIGKGKNGRNLDHTLRPDKTPKGKFIQKLVKQNIEILHTIVFDNLDENEALRLESEQIKKYGITKKSSKYKGILYNSKIPNGNPKMLQAILVESSIKEQSINGISLLRESIKRLIVLNKTTGITNSQIADYLDLTSEYGGNHKNFFTHSLLGLMLRDEEIKKVGKKYFPT